MQHYARINPCRIAVTRCVTAPALAPTLPQGELIRKFPTTGRAIQRDGNRAFAVLAGTWQQLCLQVVSWHAI
jgi:hypothetical protein